MPRKLMIFEHFVGLRYLKSHRSSAFFSKITLISIAGVAVGVWALLVVLSVMAGFEEDLRDKIMGTNANGNIVKVLGEFPEYREIVQKIEKEVPEVKAATPFVLREVMLTSEANVTGAILKGIDIDSALKVTDLRRYLDAELCFPECDNKNAPHPKSNALSLLRDPKKLYETTRPMTDLGKPSEDIQKQRERLKKGLPAIEDDTKKKDDEDAYVPVFKRIHKSNQKEILPGILIGHEMAKYLSVYIGDVITVVDPLGGGMGPTGPVPSKQSFRVAGIFYSGMFDYDLKFAYATMQAVQKLTDSGDVATGIEYRLKPEYVDDSMKIARKIEKVLGGFPYEVRDWQEMNKSLFAALKLERIAMWIILTFIVLVAAFNIASTLIMLVLEKHKEISIMKSMGASNGAIMRIFMIDGIIIGGIGVIIGVILGVVTCWLISEVGIPLNPSVYYIPNMPVKMEWDVFVLVPLSALVISFLSTIYPSLKAAKMPPVEGLRM